MVGSGPSPPLEEAAAELLRQCGKTAELDLVGSAPAFSLEMAAWATTLLYHACQFVVCRDVGEPAIVAALKRPCPEARSASADWSADLLLRYLPGTYQLARHLSPSDPLLRELRFLAVSWPLSSVGIPGLGALDLTPFWDHPGLRQLYLDRILLTGDTSRLGDPQVDEGLRVLLGAHPELSPQIARQLGLEKIGRAHV